MSFWDDLKEDFKKQAENGRIQEEKKLADKKEFKEKVKQMEREGIAHCPKCKSTSVEYIEHRKKLSIGRAIVGSALISPLGGAVGAVTSKKYKGHMKCLNCGHEWKK